MSRSGVGEQWDRHELARSRGRNVTHAPQAVDGLAPNVEHDRDRDATVRDDLPVDPRVERPAVHPIHTQNPVRRRPLADPGDQVLGELLARHPPLLVDAQQIPRQLGHAPDDLVHVVDGDVNDDLVLGMV